MDTVHLGVVLTVVAGRPHKFSVNAIVGSGTDDPLDQTPLTYAFKDASGRPEQIPLEFIVKVSDKVAQLEGNSIPSSTHQTAIRYGLTSIAETKQRRDFLLTTDSLNEQVTRETLEGQDLRREILRFFKSIYDFWPREGIGIPDLVDNFYIEQDTLTAFAEDLVSAQLLVRQRGWKKYRVNRGNVSMQTYGINSAPDSIRHIESELKTAKVTNSGLVRAFISYSTKDKHLAGQIKTCLEKYGLAVFLAHEDLHISDEWMDKIIEELKSCHVFIPLLTDNYKGSEWTDQEAGYALAFDKKVCPLKGPHNPHGFIRRKQGEFVTESKVEPACDEIIAVIRKDEKLGPLLSKSQPKQAT